MSRPIRGRPPRTHHAPPDGQTAGQTAVAWIVPVAVAVAAFLAVFGVWSAGADDDPIDLPPTPSPAVVAPAAPPTTQPPATIAPSAPTARPSATPTATPTRTPSPTPMPSPSPTRSPTPVPTATPSPTAAPAEIARVPMREPIVALTFDVGDDPGATSRTLDVLRTRQVRATFFVAGVFAERHPDLVRRMVADGHEVANHTYSHNRLTGQTDAEIRSEIERAEAVLRRFRPTPVPFIRPPLGDRDERVLRILQQLGYRSVQWGVESADRFAGASPDQVLATVQRAIPGDVIDVHPATTATARAIEQVIVGLQSRGFRIVTVSELVRAGK